ncbi:NAD(P)-dependent oxidoreductase [Actinacidiphila yeochonensis]|uniref:NAD(P)-dependent oxidoreductase n=1 Tax=Actinacidiphila yeochonensis TaxID=89050 RepID=UPI00099DA984|nr:NAD(P)-dependent oxidoreductase [Actinacidiphila yeochonensis]
MSTSSQQPHPAPQSSRPSPSGPLTVAVLGTGIMGAGMARSLAAAGHRVRAWNRTADRARPLAEYGVAVVEDPLEAVRDADAVVTMLLDGPAVLAVMRDGVRVMRQDAVWAQCSTVGPRAQRELAELAAGSGLLFLDAPVLGTRKPAETGQLTVLAAGSEAALAAAGPVFDAIGQRTVRVAGEPADGPASALKLVLNSWVLALNNATGEVMALAKALGVDPDRFFEAVDGGAMDVPYLRMKAQAIRSGDFAPSFTVEGALKDARLIAAAAEGAGVRLDLAEAGVERLGRAAAAGHGSEDMAAAYFASFTR